MPHRDVITAHIGVFIPQDCSALSRGAVVEPFRLINQLLEQEKYQIDFITEQNSAALTSLPPYQCLIILAEQAPLQPVSFKIKNALNHYHQNLTPILTVHAGVYWLLDSSIGFSHNPLKCKNSSSNHENNHTLVAHWSLHDDLKDKYPHIHFSDHLFQRNEHISSCAGQLSLFDCLLDYLQQFESAELILHLVELLCMERRRNGDEKQRIPQPITAIDRKLTNAIEIMESHIEDPLTTDHIAAQIYVSRRQLERLFKRHLDTMPARHYMQIRLKHAKYLLQTTSTSIVQIGLKCGFSSGPHFSSAYKTFYQLTPREERAKLHPSQP
ncbi:GlxA family transcriptional regulator [Vibrio hibernica]|uniref:GlxA family transcriptional regulator n=1 Tax=Vibrio hibernica TaxID=2587465 RepID=UPI0018803793|nr:helix-turn-helix domain-containing protein [Vibrio hibernica]